MSAHAGLGAGGAGAGNAAAELRGKNADHCPVHRSLWRGVTEAKHDGVALRRDVVLRLCLRERAGGGELSDCRTRRPGLPADRTAEGRDLLLRRRAGGDCGGEHHHADHGTAHILLGTVGSRNQPCRSDGGAGHGPGGSGTPGDHPPDGGASAGPAL